MDGSSRNAGAHRPARTRPGPREGGTAGRAHPCVVNPPERVSTSMTDPESTPEGRPDEDRAPEIPGSADGTDGTDLEPAFDVDLDPDDQGLAEAASEPSG